MLVQFTGPDQSEVFHNNLIWPQLFKRWITLSTGCITIHWIAQLIALLLIHWIVIYPADSAIHLLKNWGLEPVPRKSRKLFGPEKPSICEIADRLFWRPHLLTCFQGNKKKNNCVRLIKFSPFLRYTENCNTRKWPVKFRDYRETAPRSPGVFQSVASERSLCARPQLSHFATGI